MIRRVGFSEVANRLYGVVERLADEHRLATQADRCEKHVDGNVWNALSDSPMAGNIVHFMHDTGNPASPATAYQEGLFWNSVRKQTDELLAIKSGFG